MQQIAAIREETSFEITLLHERVNALLAATTFLTIAYTATRGSSGDWVALVGPVLAGFGLLLALLAWPGVSATARLVVMLTSRADDFLEQHQGALPVWSGGEGGRRRRESDQRRSLLFFRAAPGLLVVLWVVLLTSAITHPS